MLFDVAALQYLYGANMSAYAGNDTHVFSDNGINGTLWDAGGTDTIDASGLLVSATIDLHAGSYSYTENTYVAMAYNMTIEHAIGGAAADRIDGNDADNHIYGMNGGDTLLGFGGNDYVAGGNGSDVILGNHGYDALEGGLGADSMVGGNTLIDPLDNSDNIIGGEGNDHIYGCGGDDTIDAGAGIDLIVGCDGNDTLTGGAGNDIFVYINNDGNDVISDWQNGDIISISRTANIQSFSNLASRIVSVGNDTEISLEASVSILLAGVQQSALDAGDFYFWG
jgi:serralysin